MTEKRIVLRKNRAHVVQFDAADLPLWYSRRWYLGNRGYVVASGPMINGVRQRSLNFHREVMGMRHEDPEQVDHINRIRTDNRRANLRRVTPAQNSQNASSHRDSSHPEPGVSFLRNRKIYKASRMENGVERTRYSVDEATAVRYAREMRGLV